MPAGQLNFAGWQQLLAHYPDSDLTNAILGICRFGARIGYEESRGPIRIFPNLSSADESPVTVTADITTELNQKRITCYTDIRHLPEHFTASPLGLTDKSDGSKRRIHHLSYSENEENSINGGIPEEYGRITYSSVEDAISAIQMFGPCCFLLKRDFENAFRHIPIAPDDAPLLGFHGQNKYYTEQFLPFGLRTAPYLFNLFAETFHWILASDLQKNNLPAVVVHYLDDFLIIHPGEENPETYSERFHHLAGRVGLSIKASKSEQGTLVSFAGLELDTEQMVLRLPGSKLAKARTIVKTATEADSLTLLELQKITGYLNFVVMVTPLGRAFLRRLYNMQLFFPPRSRHHYQRRISREAHKDLNWWHKLLELGPERSIQKAERETIYLWTDAAGSKGLGAFYTYSQLAKPGEKSSGAAPAGRTRPHPLPGMAFSINLPRHLRRTREHINTKEMRAVEQALLYWGQAWRRKRIVMHIDNRAVAYAIENRTIRGESMNVLRRCLLLASEYDLEIDSKWIPTNDNTLADALSRFDFDRVANIAPQLIYPTFSLRDHGFLT